MGSVLSGRGKKRRTVPNWWYIPPPYDQTDAIHLFAPPIGARVTGSVKPSETLQIIGESGASVPRLVRKDLGWADITILNGKTISFTSKGETTNVGTRDPSPTKGMAILETGDVLSESDGDIIKSVGRKTKKAGRKRRKLSEWEYMTTLKGYRA